MMLVYYNMTLCMHTHSASVAAHLCKHTGGHDGLRKRDIFGHDYKLGNFRHNSIFFLIILYVYFNPVVRSGEENETDYYAIIFTAPGEE